MQAQSAVQVNDNWPMTPKSQSIAEAAKVRPIRHSGKMMVVVMRMMRDQPFIRRLSFAAVVRITTRW